MSMIKSDISSYDYLTVRLKKNKADEIINYYKRFQWVFIEQNNHKRYDDIVNATFRRNHFISNKDEIQLLQVYLENEINKMGKLKKIKNAKTISLGVSIAILGTSLVILGIFLGLLSQLIFIIFGIIIALIGMIGGLFFGLKLRKIYHNEEIEYSQNMNICYENIKKILRDLEAL